MANENIITHKLTEIVILQRESDGYFNATAMCKAAEKNIGNYMRNAETKSFLEELSVDMRISTSELIQIVKGGNAPQGTWVHPHVAVHLAQWLSPKFAVRVSSLVYGWMKESKPAHNVATVPDTLPERISDTQYQKIRTAINAISHKFWMKGSASDRMFNALRYQLNVDSVREIPADKYGAAQTLIENMDELAIEYLNERIEIEKAIVEQYVCKNIPHTGNIRQAFRARFAKRLAPNPNWSHVVESLGMALPAKVGG